MTTKLSDLDRDYISEIKIYETITWTVLNKSSHVSFLSRIKIDNNGLRDKYFVLYLEGDYERETSMKKILSYESLLSLISTVSKSKSYYILEVSYHDSNVKFNNTLIRNAEISL